MTDQTITTRFVVDANDAIQKAQQWRGMIDAIKQDLVNLKAQTNLAFKDLGKGMADVFKDMDANQLGTAMTRFGMSANQAGTAQKDMAAATRVATTELEKEARAAVQTDAALKRVAAQTQNLANFVKNVLAVAFGINLYNAIRMVITGFQQLFNEGMDLLKSFYQLEVGIRVLRRSGMEITTKDALDNIRALRKEFGVFPTAELIKGTASLSNLVRDLGFTQKQFFEIQRTAATLAIINGRSIEEVQRTMALALSSGYTEGLQRLGVSINRVTIANEAAALGWGRNYMSLTEVQRATATYNLLVEKTAKYQNDLANYTKTAAGAWEVFKASAKDFFQIGLGSNIARLGGSIVLFVKSIGDTASAMFKNIGIQSEFIASIQMAIQAVLNFGNAYGALGVIIEGVSKMMLASVDATLSLEERLTKMGVIAVKSAEAAAQLLITGKMPETFDQNEVEVGSMALAGGTEETGSEGDTTDTILQKLYEDISQQERDYKRDREEAARELQRDLAKIDRDGARDLAKIDEDYQEKRNKVVDDNSSKLRELWGRYGLEVIQTNRAFGLRRQEMDEKFREKDIQAEINYQERLRKLREGFIYDLEDALRERDARQVLNLIRRYNLEQQQAQREYNIEKAERDRQFQLERAELERERAERLQVLAEELEQKLKALQMETRGRIEEARRAWEQERAEKAEQIAWEKNERLIRFQEQMDEMKIDFEERIKEIIIQLGIEKTMTSQALAEIASLYQQVYGKNGLIDQAVANYIQTIKALSAASASAASLSFEGSISGVDSSKFGLSRGNVGSKANVRTRQQGGTDIVTSPTLFLAGEVPEIHQWTPISKMSSSNTTFGGGQGNVAPEGRIDIALVLSPDLEARIVNNALGKTANVILEMQRSQ